MAGQTVHCNSGDKDEHWTLLATITESAPQELVLVLHNEIILSTPGVEVRHKRVIASHCLMFI